MNRRREVHTQRLVFDAVAADLDGVPDDLAIEVGDLKVFPRRSRAK